MWFSSTATAATAATAVEAAASSAGANSTNLLAADTICSTEDKATSDITSEVGPISVEDLRLCYSAAVNREVADGEVYKLGFNHFQSVIQNQRPSTIQQQQPYDMTEIQESKESSVKEPFIMLTKLSAKQISQALGDPQSAAAAAAAAAAADNHKEGSQPEREIEVDNGNLMIPIEAKSLVSNKENHTEQWNPNVAQNEDDNAEELLSKLHHRETPAQETAQSSTVVAKNLQSKDIFHKNMTHDNQSQTQENMIQNLVEKIIFECRECQLKFMTISELSGHRCKKIAVKPYKWTASVLNRDP